MSLRERKYLGEAVRPGEYFVIVDVSVAGGKMVSRKLYHGVREADAEAAKLNKAGRNVQVIDAKWYRPAEKLMKALGMSESTIEEGYRIKTNRIATGDFDEFGHSLSAKVLATDLLGVADELYSARGKMRKLQAIVAGLVRGKVFGQNFLGRNSNSRANDIAEMAKDDMYKADFQIGQAAGAMEALARDIKNLK